MPKIRKCTICGREFMSYYGREVCGEQCFDERKRQYDGLANYRRKNKLSGALIDKTCPICGKRFETLRNKYCSPECSKIARKNHIKVNSKEYYQSHSEIVKQKAIKNKSKKMGSQA